MFKTVRGRLMALLSGLVLGLVVDNAEMFQSFGRLNDLSALSKGQSEVAQAILLMRRNEKDFLVRRDDKYNAAFIQTLKQFDDKVAALRSVAKNADLNAIDDDLSAISANVHTYGDLFAQIHDIEKRLGLNEESGLQGDLRAAVHKAETVFAALSEDKLSKDMLMLRRNEKDFLLRSTTKYVEAFDANYSRLMADLGSSNLSVDKKTAVGEDLNHYHVSFHALADLMVQRGLGPEEGIVGKMRNAIHATETKLAEFQELSEQSLGHARVLAMTLVAAIALAIILVSMGAGYFIISTLTRRLKEATSALEHLSKGDLDFALPPVEGEDEITAIENTLVVFRDESRKRRALEAQEIQRLNQQALRQEKISKLIQSFDANVSNVLGSVTDASVTLENTAASMSAVAEQTNRQSALVASSTEQAANNVQSVASATEELSSSIQEIGVQVGQSCQMTVAASSDANSTNQKINELSEKSSRIGEVVELINDIASQTNLLALNATIEAARAGDAGKGFAVVANEVKNLANQTAKATIEITNQIAEVKQATQEAVNSIAGIVERIQDMNRIAQSVSSAVEEQSAATQEIARSVQQAAIGTEEAADNIIGVREAASSTGAASQQVLSSAKALSVEAHELKVFVANFLNEVRVA